MLEDDADPGGEGTGPVCRQSISLKRSMTMVLFGTIMSLTFQLMILGSVALADSSANVRDDAPSIARWYNNRDAAISLRFDDALDSHVTFVIPTLNRYGIKATFMVNPGLKRYLKYKDFWEEKVPAMGHYLGNHTMHHWGAKTVQEADYEIGEVSRLIQGLYPEQSKLMVFASGGGRACNWGGARWKNAGPEYKELITKYDLIDLYDGKHPAISIGSSYSLKDFNEAIGNTIKEKRHEAFLFHKIGKPNIYDRLKVIFLGADITFGENKFVELVESVCRLNDKLWIAPLLQILKYEQEYRGASIVSSGKSKNSMKYILSVSTNSELYDQDLTINVNIGSKKIFSIAQNNMVINDYRVKKGILSLNVKPVDSEITAIYSHD